MGGENLWARAPCADEMLKADLANPDAMNKFLVHLHQVYKPSRIYITEFGTDVLNEDKVDLAKAAIDFSVPIDGIFAWSLLDNLEWGNGLRSRFGITYVDYETQTRYPKESFKWFSKLIARMDSANLASNTLVV